LTGRICIKTLGIDHRETSTCRIPRRSKWEELRKYSNNLLLVAMFTAQMRGSGTRNLADRRQPFLEHSAYLCTLKAAADGIDHLHPRRVAVSTKSDPIRNVNLSRKWHCGNLQ